MREFHAGFTLKEHIAAGNVLKYTHSHLRLVLEALKKQYGQRNAKIMKHGERAIYAILSRCDDLISSEYSTDTNVHDGVNLLSVYCGPQISDLSNIAPLEEALTELQRILKSPPTELEWFSIPRPGRPPAMDPFQVREARNDLKNGAKPATVADWHGVSVRTLRRSIKRLPAD